MNTAVINKIKSKISRAKKIAIFHHINPDGDSISCSYGLLLALKEKYPKKKIVFVANKEYLDKFWGFLDIKKKDIVESIDETYMTIIGDTSVSKRIRYFDEFQKGYYKICFDHHQNSSDSDIETDIMWRETKYPASAMQAFELTHSIQKSYSARTSFFLAIGMLSDTGHFSYSLANDTIVKYYGKLLEKVTDKQLDDYFRASRVKTKKNIALMQYIYANVKYANKVAYVVFDEAAAKKYDRKTLKFTIHSIGNIEGYPIWAMFIPKAKKFAPGWDVSIRSNGPAVNKVAAKFEGGGHIRAAGAVARKESDIKKVIAALNKLV